MLHHLQECRPSCVTDGALQEVEDRAMWATIEWGKLHPHGLQLPSRWSERSLEDAYLRCGTITSDYAKTFYLVRATQLFQQPVFGHIGTAETLNVAVASKKGVCLIYTSQDLMKDILIEFNDGHMCRVQS